MDRIVSDIRFYGIFLLRYLSWWSLRLVIDSIFMCRDVRGFYVPQIRPHLTYDWLSLLSCKDLNRSKDIRKVRILLGRWQILILFIYPWFLAPQPGPGWVDSQWCSAWTGCIRSLACACGSPGSVPFLFVRSSSRSQFRIGRLKVSWSVLFTYHPGCVSNYHGLQILTLVLSRDCESLP